MIVYETSRVYTILAPAGGPPVGHQQL